MCQNSIQMKRENMYTSKHNRPIQFSKKNRFISMCMLQVNVFQYSLHVCDPAAAEATGTHVLIRRSHSSCPILGSLVKDCGILKVSVEGLQHMLNHYKIQLRKTTTKSTKIRELLKLKQLQACTSMEERNRVENLLLEMDAKRKKKSNNPAEPAQDEEGDEAIVLKIRMQPRNKT